MISLSKKHLQHILVELPDDYCIELSTSEVICAQAVLAQQHKINNSETAKYYAERLLALIG